MNLHEAHFSTQQIEAGQKPRFFEPHEHQGRPEGRQAPPGQRPQTACGVTTPGSPLSHAPDESGRHAASDRGKSRFSQADRLHRRREYLAAQACGRRMHTPHFGVCLAPGERPRLGLVVTKRLGKAVRRNRVKRLVREFFRRHKNVLPLADIIIMAKKGAAELSYHEVHEELGRVLLPKTRAGRHG
jgi:ribonuclease P protein component